MDETLLQKWSSADKHFLCESCSFTNDAYDMKKALERFVFSFFILLSIGESLLTFTNGYIYVHLYQLSSLTDILS